MKGTNCIIKQELSNFTVTKLHQMANSKFTDIFASRKEEYDKNIQKFLQQDVFENRINKADTDGILKIMIG